jgi:hypothetical protein
MKGTMRLSTRWVFFGIAVVLLGWFSASPISAAAQSQGNNAVYNSSGNCSGCLGSGAFIDASLFAQSPPTKNFCAVLNWF